MGTSPLNAAHLLSPNVFPSLREQIGKTLVVTRGDTLLGADDKAGVAVLMDVLQTIVTDLGRAIRGGTDGAQLSARGLPCPNLFCGDHNAHGPYEYVALEDMEKSRPAR